ncbi:MAG: CotH kinase family protein [Bacteroidales bacterium]|nr:CotH kinase family protein [Bacteroidales bacterium]
MRTRIHILISILVLLATSCQKDEIVMLSPLETGASAGQNDLDGQDDTRPEPAIIPTTLLSLAKVYIDTPEQVEITSKEIWVDLCSIRILGDGDAVLYQSDSLMVKGRGNTTWNDFPKKPYALKLNHKADLLGTGKSKRYVLLANWMDRTLLRNDVAFELARRTSLEWTPSGTFVELYLNGQHQGNYWLGEKIDVEGSKFKADYLFSLDTSDESEVDFYTPFGSWPNTRKYPVQIKFPDRDKFERNAFKGVVLQAKDIMGNLGIAIRSHEYADMVNMDSFCDWYLVHELTGNMEPNHPKSCYFHVRDGKFIAGPVWDFDWYTFIPDETGLGIDHSLYFEELMKDPAFRECLKERWEALRPGFATIGEYIDSQAARIRTSAETDKELWPCWSMVNGDEALSFDDAVCRLKLAIEQRIDMLDQEMEKL